jgi:hypothetical protein
VGSLILIVNGQVIWLALGLNPTLGWVLFGIAVVIAAAVAKRAYAYDKIEQARVAQADAAESAELI